MIEEWRDIPGYSGLYQVSDLGRVRSLDRHITIERSGKTPRIVAVKGRVLRPGTSGSLDYPAVCLGGAGRTHKIHKLVAFAFLGQRPTDAVIRHLNGDSNDNRACNLAYGTRSENNVDASRHGRCKLNEETVREIRSAVANGASTQAAIARELNVGESTVSAAARGKYWNWIK